MSIALMCPACHTALVESSPPDICPRCGASLPQELRAAAKAGLDRQRPGLLTVGMIGSAIFGAVSLILPLLAPFNIGSYSINDRPVSGPEFLREIGFAWALAGLLCVAIAYGLYRERPWSRVLMMWYWLVVGLVMFLAGAGPGGSSGDLVWSIVWTAVCLLVAGAYLYGKANVVAYFRALERSDEKTVHRQARGA